MERSFVTTERAILAVVPPVSFFFRDRTLSVSEAGATFLVEQLERRPVVSETVAILAERIATESHRGRLPHPVRISNSNGRSSRSSSTR
jgi:hypothetical protein